MRIKRNYTFLYMPDETAGMRQMRVSRLALLGATGALVLLTGIAAMYLVGLWHGTSWLPGGGRLARENAELLAEVVRLEEQVAVLREDLASVYELQEMMALAMDLDPVDPDIWEAGVGGRAPLARLTRDLGHDVSQGRLASLETELDKLVRQARIQHEGYQAMLDTLARRADDLDHIPSIRPVDTGWLSSGFGKRNDPFTGQLAYHHGIDYSVPVGTLVRATAAGVVSVVKNERGFGRVIKVDHGNRIVTVYAHLSQALVKKGQRVARGEVIAESGKSGRVTAPHLHYEVRVGERRVNPQSFILDSYATR
jgi:murein DD-endopeptidase MepM/ murein hydrolase activator NlpD